MQRAPRISRNIDWITVSLYALMLLLGWMNVYAAVYSPDNIVNIFSWDINSGKQLAWIGTAVIIIIILLVIDHKAYESFAYVFYGLMILLLIFTLLFARPIAGSRSWLELGSIRIQPAEFAKFATALAVSRFMSTINLRHQNWKEHAILAGITLLPPLLILLSNETGSALVFGAFLLPFFREGMSPLILIVGTISVFLFILTLLVPQAILLGAITVLFGLYLWLNQKLMRRL